MTQERELIDGKCLTETIEARHPKYGDSRGAAKSSYYELNTLAKRKGFKNLLDYLTIKNFWGKTVGFIYDDLTDYDGGTLYR